MEVIKGTPAELIEYLNKKETKKEDSDSLFSILEQNSASKSFSKPTGHLYGKNFVRDRLKAGKHWSNNKKQWVQISEMDSAYALNVLRKMFRENSNEDLLTDDEVHSLMLILSDRFVDGK